MTIAAKDEKTCLLCDKRTARGILYRITPPSKKVPLQEGESTPHVCVECGAKQNRTEGKPFNGLSTIWRFTPYPKRRKPEPAS